MRNRSSRNRKRSQRRAIYCPIHGIHLDSVSQKHGLYADRAGQLQERGIVRKRALLLLATRTTIAITGEWLEAFWCDGCQRATWYHIHKTGDRTYEVSPAPRELWQQVGGVIHPDGNPTVGEFTRRHSRRGGPRVKDFRGL